MRVKFKLPIFAFILLGVASSYGQDTLRMMTYNILNYPSTAVSRSDTLAVITGHVKPDILIVNELENVTGANALLNSINNGGITYARATYFNGPYTDNMCFYNTEKLGLISQNQIGTDLRDISEYSLYYKGNLPSIDTVFLHVYAAHLKAGNNPPGTNEARRFSEAEDLKDWLQVRHPQENVLVGGDFNIYKNTEAAYNELLTGGLVDLFDPINRPGVWNNNSSFADIHTQATSTVNHNGGSGGGMDDRFDFWLVSDDVLSGQNDLKYLTDSYKAFGQDGLHFNNSLIGFPFPSSSIAPKSVINALYNMSDHLPVIMDVVIDESIDVAVYSNSDWELNFSGIVNKLNVDISNAQDVQLEVVDLLGKKQIATSLDVSKTTISLDHLISGSYIVRVYNDKFQNMLKFTVTH